MLIAPLIAAVVYVALLAPLRRLARLRADRQCGLNSASLWLAALLFAVVLMALVWRLAVRIGNAGIVDIAWAAGFAPVVIATRRPRLAPRPGAP